MNHPEKSSGEIRRRKSVPGHWKLLFFWPAYFFAFLLLETGIPPEKCHVIHCQLDDRIPFCEWFLLPYVFWYFCLAGISLYTLMRDEPVFCRFMHYLILTTGAAFAFYILYPSRQELRIYDFPRENALTAAVRLLYRVDTSTNIFPSLHVMHTFGILSAGLRAKGLEGWGWKWFFAVTAVLVCLSTVFLRQHSVLDGLCALPLSAGAEWICYGGYAWMNCSKRKTA